MLTAVASDFAVRTSLLAQGAAPGGGGGGGLLSFAPLILIGVMAYFLFIVPQQKKQRLFQQMLADLKQNDHVITTGGLHGVVTNVNRETGLVTLRTDEATGAKIRVAMWAIDSVPSQTKNKEKETDAKASSSKNNK